MTTRIINNNEIKDEEVDKLLFNVSPSDDATLTTIESSNEDYLVLSCDSMEAFVDKHSIGNLIVALQEAKRLWGDK